MNSIFLYTSSQSNIHTNLWLVTTTKKKSDVSFYSIIYIIDDFPWLHLKKRLLHYIYKYLVCTFIKLPVFKSHVLSLVYMKYLPDICSKWKIHFKLNKHICMLYILSIYIRHSISCLYTFFFRRRRHHPPVVVFVVISCKIFSPSIGIFCVYILILQNIKS